MLYNTHNIRLQIVKIFKKDMIKICDCTRDESEDKMTGKEKILAYMQSKEYIPLKLAELYTVLDVPEDKREEFSNALSELEEYGEIIQSKKGRYVAAEKTEDKVVGKLSCSARGFFAFLIPDDDTEDIYINGNDLKDAYDGDRVIVRLNNQKTYSGKREGCVVKILKRGNTTLTGVVEKEKKGYFYILCDNKKKYFKIRVKPENMLGAVIGERVVAEITEYDSDGKVYGIVTKNMGDAKALLGNVEAIIYSHGICEKFDDAVLSETENMPSRVYKRDMADRLDLREKTIFTIDGETARDFDDAVSIEILDNGNYYLGVHIADVTHYVTEGSATDRAAFERATSVYLADRVIPMLPEKLSNGICSLNPRVNRLTLSVFMEIDKSGTTVRHKLCKSVIRSAERMTYNAVTALLDGTNEKLNKRYDYIIPDLKIMAELAEILRKKRMERGSIDFNFAESKVIVNDIGEPVDIVKVKREVSHRLIEEFMLAANETVAEYAFWAELPFVYRIHEVPDGEKIDAFNRFIFNFGVRIKGRYDDGDLLHPKALQQVLEKVRGTPEEYMISTYLLRSLMKAKYSPENKGHFGLAAKYYTHFTSPIRRYPDLAIHRILKNFIDGKLNNSKIAALEGFVSETALNSTEKQTEADNCERDVDDLMKTVYMSQFIGDSFCGVVSSVTAFGMFVSLENSVEGLIRVENMSKDYFEYNDTLKRFEGKRTSKVYKVGDSVEVVLVRTDLMTRQIDFILSEDATKYNIDRINQKAENQKSEKERELKRLEKGKGKQFKSKRGKHRTGAVGKRRKSKKR